ncbi:MAG: BrnT family toxin [Synergistaceae bacterium]|nr:BrnT family toxin [Synergistaceae bacterium]
MEEKDRRLMSDEVKYVSQGGFFTWDDDKALANWKKHGVSFRDAADVFADVYAIDLPDVGHMEEEDRRQIIGRMSVRWKILFVVYVERTIREDVDVYRIISARPATLKERRLYEDGISK